MSSRVVIYSDEKDPRNDLVLSTDVSIAPNEPMINNVFNRNFRTLLQNDKKLNELYKKVFSQLNISDYSSAVKYDVGDMVWYEQDGKLYVLKCISDQAIEPNITLLSEDPVKPSDGDLKKSGWENLNRYMTIFDYGMDQLIASLVQNKYDAHQTNIQYHPFGKISLDSTSDDYVGEKILKKDLSNIDIDRKSTFFPYQMIKMKSSESIATGYMRDYGKVVEYDIIFKLGQSDVDDGTQLFFGSKELSANVFSLNFYTGLAKNSLNYNENVKYFQNSDALNIFAKSEDDEYEVKSSTIGLLKQQNRNNYVNTYAATVVFTQPFLDLNYMVFSNSMLCQTSDGSLIPSQNDIVVCNKMRDRISFVNIQLQDQQQYGFDSNAATGGLAANSFHCKIIGRTST